MSIWEFNPLLEYILEDDNDIYLFSQIMLIGNKGSQDIISFNSFKDLILLWISNDHLCKLQLVTLVLSSK